MPQPRVSATGFGGRPGLSIMAGHARGVLRREEIERENERQAILNRVSEQQIESMAQSMRHAQEDQDFERMEQERDQLTRVETAKIMTQQMQERYPNLPSINEDVAMDVYGKVDEQALRWAQQDAAEARTSAARSATESSHLDIQAKRKSAAALELMANPRFWSIYTFAEREESYSGGSRGGGGGTYTKQTERQPGVISEQTRRDAIEAEFSDTDPMVRELAMNGLRELSVQVQGGTSPYPQPGSGEKYSGDQVRLLGDKLINSQGSIEAAIEYLKASMRDDDATETRLGQQVLDDLIKRAGGDSGSGITASVNAELNAQQ